MGLRIAIDAGNSNTTIALFGGDEIGPVYRIPTEEVLRSSDPDRLIRRSVKGRSGPDRPVDGAVLSSVIPDLVPPLSAALAKITGADPVVVGPSLDLGIEIGYERPEELGPDRIADAVAGYAEVEGAVVVVDLGTATTFNAVTAEGLFLGGAIAPGLVTGAEAIARRGARLFDTDLSFPDEAIGRSTEEALRSGSLWGAVALVDGMVERFRNELGGCVVLATGGLAGIVAPRAERIDRWDPLLTLKGLTRIYERNRPV